MDCDFCQTKLYEAWSGDELKTVCCLSCNRVWRNEDDKFIPVDGFDIGNKKLVVEAKVEAPKPSEINNPSVPKNGPPLRFRPPCPDRLHLNRMSGVTRFGVRIESILAFLDKDSSNP